MCAFACKFSILEGCGARSVYTGAFVLKVGIVKGWWCGSRQCSVCVFVLKVSVVDGCRC